MYLRDLQDEDFEVAIKVEICSYPKLPHDYELIASLLLAQGKISVFKY